MGCLGRGPASRKKKIGRGRGALGFCFFAALEDLGLGPSFFALHVGNKFFYSGGEAGPGPGACSLFAFFYLGIFGGRREPFCGFTTFLWACRKGGGPQNKKSDEFWWHGTAAPAGFRTFSTFPRGADLGGRGKGRKNQTLVYGRGHAGGFAPAIFSIPWGEFPGRALDGGGPHRPAPIGFAVSIFICSLGARRGGGGVGGGWGEPGGAGKPFFWRR